MNGTPPARRILWFRGRTAARATVVSLAAVLASSPAGADPQAAAGPPFGETQAAETRAAETQAAGTQAAETQTAGTQAAGTAPAGTAKPASKIRSEEDGAFDVSSFLDTAYGFVPILVPITEPAVGYGGALGFVFINRPIAETAKAGFGRPNLTMVGGAATENGTRAVMAADVRQWMDDRVQTVAAILDAKLNLDFYGVGQDEVLEHDPLRYTLEPLGGGVRGRFRLGGSRLWVGVSYVLADTHISFDDQSLAAALLDPPEDSRIGGLTPSLTFDSRDNIFTPTRGTYFEGSTGVYDEALGGDTSFQRVALLWIVYRPLHPRVFFGVKSGLTFSFDNPPFYMLPYISLRGAPVLRYQGEEAAEVETEVRWQCWKRWSVVGFAGTGAAWNDFEDTEDVKSIVTGGAGVRYELARKYGLHFGLDAAWGPDDSALYIQFGSAWARP